MFRRDDQFASSGPKKIRGENMTFWNFIFFCSYQKSHYKILDFWWEFSARLSKPHSRVYKKSLRKNLFFAEILFFNLSKCELQNSRFQWNVSVGLWKLHFRAQWNILRIKFFSEGHLVFFSLFELGVNFRFGS